MKPVVLALCTALLLAPSSAVAADPPGAPGIVTPEAKHDADNTARNTRDRDDDKKLPVDQSNDPQDLEITRQIRKAVVAKDGLSINAQNVKIITADAVVTLRGPVKSEQERQTIAEIATNVAGVKRVNNQLEIESNP
ncbi:MAG TPA: BON domain-containing protein [Terriglobales bacterium]|nr:BON domain-containing protein [Terriglobales bacterium]